MLKLKVWLLGLLVIAVMAVPVMAGTNKKAANGNAANTTSTEGSPTAGDPNPTPSPSPTPSVGLGITPSASDGSVTALLGVLVMKGILAPTEANAIREASPTAQFQALVETLSQKGLVSAQDLSVITAVPGPMAMATQAAAPAKPAAPAVIPAVAPVRVLPINIPKQAGMVPDIKLGSGANMKLYGFYKASAVSDTASSGGPTFGSQDWPLPLLLADTGPTSDPQVHVKARQFRIGAQTEWVPKGSDFTITGKIEADFEGDYTDVNNRNISGSARSQFSLRQAWVRLDHKISGLPWFAEFGEDWSLLGSSSLPALFETTGAGVGMGSLYERMPMFKTGVQIRSGDFIVQPEFAIVQSSAGSAALTTDQRLRFGDRAGAESNQPGVEGRVVFQFPLNKSWKGVAPAEIIFSGHHSRMNEIIPHAKQTVASAFTFTPTCTTNPDGTISCDPVTVPVPTIFTAANTPNLGFSTATSIVGASNCPETSGICNLEQIFPHGIEVGNAQNIWTAEVQLPTPWVTLVAKFYRGNDMRFFFGGQLNDVWANLNGLTEVGSGISESGRGITFGCADGVSGGTGIIDCPGTPVQSAILQPVGGSGGFAELSFPLSRIFHANPNGLNSGWVLHVQYGTDRAKYSDARKSNHLGRTDLDTASLTYRLNKWCTFVYELSYIATFTAPDESASGVFTQHLVPFAGKEVAQAHNWRNEFGPVFTF
ncbi:MAG: hypothetical protein WCB94_02250 [Terriglobales bacterium]